MHLDSGEDDILNSQTTLVLARMLKLREGTMATF